MTSAGVLVSAATQATKQSWKASVERGKDIAEMIMRGRAVHIGPKTPQQIDLPLAKSRDVGKCLRPRKNRQENQQQHFRERVILFTDLMMILQLTEIVEKTGRLGNFCKACPVGIDRPPPATQWITTDSAL